MQTRQRAGLRSFPPSASVKINLPSVKSETALSKAGGNLAAQVTSKRDTPCPCKTLTCRSFDTLSSGFSRFLDVADPLNSRTRISQLLGRPMGLVHGFSEILPQTYFPIGMTRFVAWFGTDHSPLWLRFAKCRFTKLCTIGAKCQKSGVSIPAIFPASSR